VGEVEVVTSGLVFICLMLCAWYTEPRSGQDRITTAAERLIMIIQFPPIIRLGTSAADVQIRAQGYPCYQEANYSKDRKSCRKVAEVTATIAVRLPFFSVTRL
jgi:hypothetical protein